MPDPVSSMWAQGLVPTDSPLERDIRKNATARGHIVGDLQMRISDFAESDSGAVTVDWVVLTGSLVGLGIATAGVVSGGVESLSSSISDTLSNIDVSSVAAFEPEPGWGELSMFVFSDQAGADAHMLFVLEYSYGNDVQAMYDDVVANLDAAIQSNDLDAAHYEVDRLGYLVHHASSNNITLTGDNQPSYAQMHARVLAMSQ